jgi:hypothetical protein
MAMYDTAEKLHEECKELFPDNGTLSTQQLSQRQLWFIVKVAKGARLYCRTNTAFNNFFNSIFQGVARFRQVEKTKPGGDTYEGLFIEMAGSDDDERE